MLSNTIQPAAQRRVQRIASALLARRYDPRLVLLVLRVESKDLHWALLLPHGGDGQSRHASRAGQDVCVVAGIAGITSAYLLARKAGEPQSSATAVP